MPSGPSLRLVVVGVEDVDVRLAEDDEEIALARVLQGVNHVEVGVHTRLQYGNAAQTLELGGVRFVIKCAGDDDVETSVCGLARRFHEVRA